MLRCTTTLLIVLSSSRTRTSDTIRMHSITIGGSTLWWSSWHGWKASKGICHLSRLEQHGFYSLCDLAIWNGISELLLGCLVLCLLVLLLILHELLLILKLRIAFVIIWILARARSWVLLLGSWILLWHLASWLLLLMLGCQLGIRLVLEIACACEARMIAPAFRIKLLVGVPSHASSCLVLLSLRHLITII